MRDCFFPAHSFSISHFQKIEEAETDWDAILPINHHLKSLHLKAIEKADIQEFTFQYLLIYRDQQCIGLAYLQLLNLKKQHVGDMFQSGDSNSIFSQYLLTKGVNLAVCGHMFRNNWTGFYFKTPEDNALIFDVLNRHAKRNSLKVKPDIVVIKECEEQVSVEILKSNKFQAFNHDLLFDFNVDQDWTCFDDYAGSLSSKYQKRAQKIREQGKVVERIWLDEKQIIKHMPEIMNCYLELVNRQAYKPGKLTADYFLHLKQTLGHQFQILGYFSEGNIFGFASYILDENQNMELYYVGFQEASNQAFSLYFNMLFDAVAFAIEQKFKVVHLGRTGHDAKTSLGAKSRLANNYFKVNHSVKGWVLKNTLENLKAALQPQGPTRNPFKQELQSNLA